MDHQQLRAPPPPPPHHVGVEVGGPQHLAHRVDDLPPQERLCVPCSVLRALCDERAVLERDEDGGLGAGQEGALCGGGRGERGGEPCGPRSEARLRLLQQQAEARLSRGDAAPGPDSRSEAFRGGGCGDGGAADVPSSSKSAAGTTRPRTCTALAPAVVFGPPTGSSVSRKYAPMCCAHAANSRPKATASSTWLLRRGVWQLVALRLIAKEARVPPLPSRASSHVRRSARGSCAPALACGFRSEFSTSTGSRACRPERCTTDPGERPAPRMSASAQ